MADGVHYENPFVDPLDSRAPARRFRGRLPLPVTLWSAGTTEDPVGLTVSSVLVAEGEPPRLLGLVSPTTDLHDAIADGGSFVVHVLPETASTTAEIFAGLRPSPGGPFEGRELHPSEWGPALVEFGTRAYCRVVATRTMGFHSLVESEIENIEIEDGDTSPLAFWRGHFRRLIADD